MSTSKDDGKLPPGRSAISAKDPGTRDNLPLRSSHARKTATLNGYVTPAVYKAPAVSSNWKSQTLTGTKRPHQGNAGPVAPIQVKVAGHETVNQPEGSRSLTARALRPSQGSRRHIPQPQNEVPINTINTKKTLEIKPLWQELDNLHNDEILRLHKRELSHRRRVGGKAAANGRNQVQDENMRMNNDHAEIAPALRLIVNGVVDTTDSDEDDVRYRPQPRIVDAEPRNGQKAVKLKAARKINYRNTTSSESEDSDLETEMESNSSSTSEEAHVSNSPKSDSDVDMEDQLVDDVDDAMPDIVLLDKPPSQPLHSHSDEGQIEPPNDLVEAIQALFSSDIRMQQTKQLPFLARNLRKGFTKRCSELYIPIYSDAKPVRLTIIYEYVDGLQFQRSIKAWICPLCNLLGHFKTREMLVCHLEWDHGNVFCEWRHVENMNSRAYSWELRLLIPENQQTTRVLSDKEEDIPTAISEPTLNVPSIAYMTPQSRRLISPFPSVSLSPSTQPTVDTDTDTLHSPTPTFKTERKPDPGAISSTRGFSSVTSSSAYRERSTTGSTSLGPSTSTSTRNSVTSSRTGTTTRTQPLQLNNRGIMPPPPRDPLGAAVQYPYLPAESDYGGPTVYYSCRPSGPSLVDLLGTLPMEPFGVLDWDVIDRQEEIFESDDLKDEYKVIQALWMRWIILNRNRFVTNYLKGCIAFVDQYWKIIHKAAGWGALRYQLLILLANQYLNGHDMAQVLRHYEELTDMANWYN